VSSGSYTSTSLPARAPTRTCAACACTSTTRTGARRTSYRKLGMREARYRFFEVDFVLGEGS
jgi:hypothetical protein